LQRIKDAKPQAVFIFVPAGKYATAVMKAWSDLGLKEAGIQLVTTQDVMLDEELPNMGDIPLGCHVQLWMRLPESEMRERPWLRWDPT